MDGGSRSSFFANVMSGQGKRHVSVLEVSLHADLQCPVRQSSVQRLAGLHLRHRPHERAVVLRYQRIAAGDGGQRADGFQ